MSHSAIRCPHCQKEIELTETLTGQIKSELQNEFSAKERAQSELIAKKEQALSQERTRLEQERLQLEGRIEEKVKAEKEKLLVIAQEKAQEKLGLELQDLKQQKAERDLQLEIARKNELALRAEARLLEEKTKNLDLELERRLDSERKKIEEKLKDQQSQHLEERLRGMQEEFRKKELEKDKQMEILKRSLDEAQRKSAQASMQIQGEVQEADLKRLLETHFPLDTISDVATGIKGADLIQTVKTQFGQTGGVILWESKNTKQWSNEWIKKMKGDQGLSGADICMLVSKVLPDGMSTFGCIDGIWVLDAQYAIPVTSMLRQHLIQLYQTKNSLLGQETKKDFLYEYISSSQFKTRFENIIMGFKSLKEELETEKRSMQRIWSKREKEIERVIMNTSGMYGDMQGIIGASLPTVPTLELETEPTNLTLL